MPGRKSVGVFVQQSNNKDFTDWAMLMQSFMQTGELDREGPKKTRQDSIKQDMKFWPSSISPMRMNSIRTRIEHQESNRFTCKMAVKTACQLVNDCHRWMHSTLVPCFMT